MTKATNLRNQASAIARTAPHLPNQGSAIARTGRAEQSEAERKLRDIEAISVTNDRDYRLLAHLASKAKWSSIRLDQYRRELIEPFQAYLTAIAAHLRPAIETYAAAEGVAKDRLIAFAKAARRAGETEPTVDALQLRAVWVGQLVDVNAIPAEYRTPDLATLNALTKVKKGDLRIPGWEVHEDLIAAITVSGAK